MTEVLENSAGSPDGPEAPGSGGFLEPPSVSLPKGGGAIRGIGEKFVANPVTGTGSLTVPIRTSPGRSGFGPQLALSYDSGSGSGIFGFGWILSLPSITRKTDKGLPRYDDSGDHDSDVFILTGAEDLVPVLVESNGAWARPVTPPRTLPDGSKWKVERYRPRIEGLFARIERWTNESGETHWRSISKDNVTTLYGQTDESRIADPDDPRRVFSWLICESYDDRGNAILYGYSKENGDQVDTTSAHERNRTTSSRSANRHLKRIKYGNVAPRQPNEELRARTDWLFEVVLDYGEHDALTPGSNDPWLCRDDPFSFYRAGFEIRSYRLCRRVLMFHHFPAETGVGVDCLVHSTDFGYRGTRIGSFLRSVAHTGYLRGFAPKSLPPLELDYTEAVVQHTVRVVDADSTENLPSGVDGSRSLWVDLDGEGLSGVLTPQPQGWYYKRNLSPVAVDEAKANGRAASFAPAELVAAIPSLTQLWTGRQQLLDLAGDGKLDLVELGRPLSGFYERTEDERWRDFVAFESMPEVAWDDPNLRFVDLTGDGHADVLIADDCAFTWYPSLAEDGFASAERVARALDEETRARVVFADGTESIHLADLSGDGLTDLVRIRNGEVCYWPNLGYGVFGARVSMDRAPWFDTPELFDPKRLHLADIDGSGVTDIVYLGRAGVQLYFNEAGNSWSPAQRLASLPPVDDLLSVDVVDLFGNGTACLVWSSPLPGDARSPMRYVDLMGGQKPHLLIGVRNNLGAETRITYAPSTRFYLQDRLAGQPWVTRLPFPVHVVERVETDDRISRNRFVTRYAYHHGYYDGEEREFRGFGFVEQWDTEEFAALSATGALGDTTNLDETSHLPPVCTKTWFHTGAYLDGRRISRHFEHDYYREDLPPGRAERMLLDDTVLPDTIRLRGQRQPFQPSTDEEREAVRALKGAILRQEIYALDQSGDAERPYSVSEGNHTLEMLQPRGANQHAVFFAHPRETVDFVYERKLYEVNREKVADPRVTHALTLEVDEFGNVRQAVTAAYGRRYDDPDPVLTTDDRKLQKQTLVTLTESDYTNPVDEDDAFRVPQPCEVRTYELLNAVPASSVPGVTNLFTFDDLLKPGGIIGQLDAGSRDLSYETLSAAGLHRRLIEHLRLLYRRNDLTAPLPLGGLQSLALPYEGYRLAFPKLLLSHVYTRGSGGGTVEDLIPDPFATMTSAGYVRSNDLKSDGAFPAADPDDEWWIPSGRIYFSPDRLAQASQERIEGQKHFFLPRRYHDAFNEVTAVTYDPYDLLVQETRDAVGNAMTAGRRSVAGAFVTNGNDYRVLQPRLVMDANRNRSEVVFDVLGLVVATALMGKPNQHIGDSVHGVNPELADTVVAASLQDPLLDPHAILQGATRRLLYDLFAYVRTSGDAQPQPPVVYTLARETHESDLGPNDQTQVQHSFSYTDGFGREIQGKIQAEPGPNGAARWVGSGWTVFNNKGMPVRKYEPFFSSTHRFEFARSVGISPILLYDPLGRVRATVHRNHTYEKVTFDPWRQESWDVNDTVAVVRPETDSDVGPLIRRLPPAEYQPTWFTHMQASAQVSERQAASAAYYHRDTPTASWFDALGRPFLTVMHNRFERGGAEVEERHRTRLELDIEGNQREIVDARGRSILQSDFDMLGRRIHTASMDAGERWTLEDSTSKPVLGWDSRGHKLATDYDSLRRAIEVRLQEGTAPEAVIQRTVYGESRPNPEAKNLRRKAVEVFDAAGLLTMDDYDFKGPLKRSRRKLATSYKTRLDWSGSVPLESEQFEARTLYDALGRPVEMTTPDGSVLRPAYNEATLLERLEGNLGGSATVTRFVDDINYDEKGRRTRIAYSNGASTSYAYDRETFRLMQMSTTRDADVLQDIRYTYDAVGNITHVQDNAQQGTFFANQLIEPHADYVFDAVYRLIEASGRERLSIPAGGEARSSAADSLPGVEAMARYTEVYSYDEVGNIGELHHTSRSPTVSPWKVKYDYRDRSLVEHAQRSNVLSSTTIGSGAGDPYTHDEHGNMTSMNHLQVMRWNHRNELQATVQQVVGPGATPETTYYVYDAAGERVRKVTERFAGVGGNPTRMKERIYLGGFEIYREYDATGKGVSLERQTLHVTDDTGRIALVETRTRGTDSAPRETMRFQLTNHLGSACLELDSIARIISYEEFFPYGGTSYQAVRNQTESPKRYRFTGKERDSESGLYYLGARYYAPWLGRFVSCDPAGVAGGINLYLYASANPCGNVDAAGTRDINWAKVGKGALYAAAGIVVVGAVILTVGALAPTVVGGVMLGVGFSAEAAGAAAATTIGLTEAGVLTLTAYGTAQAAKTSTEVATGVDLDTGQILNDDEWSERLGESFVNVGAMKVGQWLESRSPASPEQSPKAPQGPAPPKASGSRVVDDPPARGPTDVAPPQPTSASRPPAPTPPEPTPPPPAPTPPMRGGGGGGGGPGASRLIDLSTPERYYVQDSSNHRLKATGDVGPNGELQISIRTKIEATDTQPKQESTVLNGPDQFAKILKFFAGEFTSIKGSWQYGSNLDKFNKLTGQGVPENEAAAATWTGEQAAAAGFKGVKVTDKQGKPGKYTSVQVSFTRE